MEKYVNAVAKGKSFLVMKRSKPVFRLSPVPDEIDLKDDGPGWRTVIDFTKIRKGGVPGEEVIKALDKLIEQDRG